MDDQEPNEPFWGPNALPFLLFLLTTFFIAAMNRFVIGPLLFG